MYVSSFNDVVDYLIMFKLPISLYTNFMLTLSFLQENEDSYSSNFTFFFTFPLSYMTISSLDNKVTEEVGVDTRPQSFLLRTPFQ